MTATPDGVLATDATEHGSWAWIGLRLTPAPATAPPRRPDRSVALREEQAWLAAQWSGSGMDRFEVRYDNAPGTPGLTCALLGRTHAADRPAAVAAALALRGRLARTPRHVRAEPITDGAELHRRLHPFPPDIPPGGIGLAEIRKRLTWAKLGRQDTPRPLGVAVHPLGGTERSWEPVWAGLAGLPHRAVLSVCLEPRRVTPEQTTWLRYLTQEYARLAAAGPRHPYQQRLLPDPFAELAHPLLADALRRYTGRAYGLRITVAEEVPTAPPSAPSRLAELLADTLDGVAVPVAATETETALGNLRTLDRQWLDLTYHQDVPAGHLYPVEQILSDLTDLPEAAAAFRLPHRP